MASSREHENGAVGDFTGIPQNSLSLQPAAVPRSPAVVLQLHLLPSSPLAQVLPATHWLLVLQFSPLARLAA